MNTTEAATTAGVTVATIRTWARRNVIAAVKTSGRWTIDAASLAHRIALAARRAARKTARVVLTTANLIAIGGSRWTKGDHDRVYLNNWAELAGLEADYYKSGNICFATYQGEGISNSEARRILGSLDKVWFDTATGKLHCRFGYASSTDRDQVWANVCIGVRAAIAAL